MRSAARRFVQISLALALLSACTNKGLGVEPTGRTIGQAKGTRVVLLDESERTQRPSFAGETLDGTPLSSSDFRGSVTVVNFWASWCPPCREEQRTLEQLWRQWKPEGVRFVGVDIRDDLVDAKAFVDEYDVTYPSIFNKDSSIAAKFRVVVPPSTFVLDQRGRIAGRIIGAVTKAEFLNKLLDAVTA